MQVIPYLAFNGTCAEAMTFYAELLGGQLDMMTFDQMPSEPGAPPLPEQAKGKVANAQVSKDGAVLLMASDFVQAFSATSWHAPQGMTACLNLDSEAEGRRVFDALAEGGQVTMPYAKTFWAEGFGVVIDRFGTPWMINGKMLG